MKNFTIFYFHPKHSKHHFCSNSCISNSQNHVAQFFSCMYERRAFGVWHFILLFARCWCVVLFCFWTWPWAVWCALLLILSGLTCGRYEPNWGQLTSLWFCSWFEKVPCLSLPDFLIFYELVWETAGELAFCTRDGLWPFEGHFFQNPQLRKCCCFYLQHWHVLISFFESGKSDSQPLWFEFVSLSCICLILQWQFFQQSFCLLTFLQCRLHFDQCSMILSCIFVWVDWNVSDLCVLSQLQSALWIILPEADKLSLLFERLCLQKFRGCFVSMVFVKIGRSVCVVGI